MNFLTNVVGSGDYTNKFIADLADFNSAPACGEGSIFRQIRRSNGEWVCNLSGEGPNKTETFEAFASNEEILNFLDIGFYEAQQNVWRLHELHAQIFGWTCFNHGARPRFDKMLENGAFPRLRAVAASELLL